MLTQDRNTHAREVGIITLPVAATAVIYAGALVVVNATGYAAKGSEALNLKYAGRAEEHVDNSGGANGAKTIDVRIDRAFQFKNSATDPIAQAQVGTICYIEDDETVSATDNESARSAAGKVMEVSATGVWVAPAF